MATKKNSDKLLDLYDELMVAVVQLSERAPVILSKYNEFESVVDSSKEIINEGKTEALEEITKLQKSANQKLNREVKKVQEQVDESIEEMSELIKELTKLNKQANLRIKKLNEALDVPSKTEVVFSKIFDRLDRLEGSVFLEIDYDEYATIQELYDKYHGKIGKPIVVHKRGWTADYCYVVESIEDGMAQGQNYRKGELHSEEERSATSGSYQMYSGHLPVIQDMLL